MINFSQGQKFKVCWLFFLFCFAPVCPEWIWKAILILFLATFFRCLNFCANFCCTSVTHSKVFLKNLKVEQDFNCVLLPLSVNFPLVVNVNLWSFNSSELCSGRRNRVTICFGIIPGIRFRNYPGDKIVHTRSLGLINLTLDSSTLPSILFAERQGIQNIIQKMIFETYVSFIPGGILPSNACKVGQLGNSEGERRKNGLVGQRGGSIRRLIELLHAKKLLKKLTN